MLYLHLPRLVGTWESPPAAVGDALDGPCVLLLQVRMRFCGVVLELVDTGLLVIGGRGWPGLPAWSAQFTA